MNANALDSYLNAITKVTVGSTEYSKDSFYFDENNYRVKTIDDSQGSKKDCLDLAETGINATEGTVITVEAKGYETMTYTLKGESSVVKPDPSEPETSKDAPTVSAGVKQDKGSFDSYARYRFTFKGMSSSDLTAYLSAVKEVTVEETSYSPISGLGMDESMYKIGTSGYSGYNYIELADNAFKTSEETNIVIKADGYKDLTIKFDVTNPIKADVPTATVTKADDTTYRMTFPGMDVDELKTYLTAVQSDSTATVGGKAYTSAGAYAFSVSANKYLVKDSSNDYGSNYDCIDFHANDGFAASGDTKIVITAPGYKDLKCTYSAGDNGQTETPDNGNDSGNTSEGKDTPAIGSVGYEKWDKTYRMLFTGDVDDFFNAISSVSVNENVYTGVAYSWDFKEKNYITKPNDKYIDFTPDGFSDGKNKIVIKATGYKDLKYTYTK